MNKILVVIGIAFFGYTLAEGVSMAQTINFDADPVGTAPLGWSAGVTGRGAHRWTVEADASGPSKPNVLKQSGRGDFPWCVKNEPHIADGYVEVKFKPVSGGGPGGRRNSRSTYGGTGPASW